MIVVGGWSGRNVVGLNGRFGVRPAGFAVGGDFDNPFEDDVDPGDETTEFVGVVQSLPASGTVVFDDDGGFEHTGAADGSYSTVFTLYTWAQGGPVTKHTPNETITTNFGAGTSGTASGVTFSAAASLINGVASGGATAAGLVLSAAASLAPGAASGAATAAGALLTAAASILAGSASAGGSATAPGQTLAAAALLVAGAASGEVNGTAAGFLAAAAASLIPGAADAGTAAPGALLVATTSLVPGSASGVADSTAAGALFVVGVNILAGGAFGPIFAATKGYTARLRLKRYSAPR